MQALHTRLFSTVFLWIVALLSDIAAMAQQPVVRNYTRTDYASGRQNWCIDQTPTGVTLFANTQGLLTFDSREWHTHPLPNFSDVRAIYYERERDIIFAGGSNELGYFEHEPPNGRLRFRSLVGGLPAEAHDFGEVWAIFRCSNGNYVFQAKRHVFVMRPDGSFRVFRTDRAIMASSVSPFGTILAMRGGLMVIRDMKLQELSGTDVLADKQVQSILPMPDGRVLFATAADGLYVFDGQATTPFELPITPWLRENQIFCATLRGMTLALGTVGGGAAIVDLRPGGQTYFANRSTGLGNNTVLSLRFDVMGNLWLGLDQGLAFVLTQAPYKELLGHDNPYGSGYASLIDGGRLWLGTNQGLYVCPWREGITTEMLAPVPQLTGQVWSLRRIDGDILCGSNQGAWQLAPGGWRRIAGMEETWDFRPLRHHPGLVLACDYKGLCVLERRDGLWRLRNRIAGTGISSGSFEEAEDGTVWISHWQEGIFRLWLNAGLDSVSKTMIYNRGNSLPTDDNNLLARVGQDIVVTAADGFHRFDFQKDALVPDTMLNRKLGIHYARLRLQEDPQGNLWAFSAERITVLHSDGEADSMTFRTLAPRLQHSFGHVGFTPQKEVILNTENGFMLADPSSATGPRPGRLFVRSIEATATDSILYVPATDSVRAFKLTLPKRLNSLRLRFVLPEYHSADAVTYECRLEGFDAGWLVAAGGTKEYTSLPRGRYLLRVRAANSVSGQTDEISVAVQILPAWYETWWAFLIYILLAACALALLARSIVGRYNRKLAEATEQRRRELKEKETQFALERQREQLELARLRNEQQETELKHKSSQLADSTMNLIRKNDMLQLLDQRMDELSESVRREDPKTRLMQLIREIRREIGDNIQEDENWDRFEQNFNLVYDNFLSRLRSDYPDLKLSDLKLCAYLRMGLSSKEMASLLNVSVRSVETARYRLRKKLNLQQGENLQGFLQTDSAADDDTSRPTAQNS